MGAQSRERAHHLSSRACRSRTDGLAQARELLCHRPRLSRSQQDLEVPPPNCHCPPSCGLFYEEHRQDKYQYRQALRKLRRAAASRLQRGTRSATSLRALTASTFTTFRLVTARFFCFLEPYAFRLCLQRHRGRQHCVRAPWLESCMARGGRALCSGSPCPPLPQHAKPG